MARSTAFDGPADQIISVPDRNCEDSDEIDADRCRVRDLSFLSVSKQQTACDKAAKNSLIEESGVIMPRLGGSLRLESNL